MDSDALSALLSDGLERRMDTDRRAYTLEQFRDRYGGTREWQEAIGRPCVGRRLDGDGLPHTLQSFIEFHGEEVGREYWNQSEPADPPPHEMTHMLKTKTESVDELLRMHRRHMAGAMNHIHVATCWSRLGELTVFTKPERRWIRHNAKALEPLREHTLAMLPLLDGRSLAVTAHGVAAANLVTLGPWWRRLLDEVADSALGMLNEMETVEMATLVHAFGKAGHRHSALFDALSVQVEHRIAECDEQALANIAWAYASNRHYASSLFRAIGDAAAPRIGGFVPQGLVAMAWAFTMMRAANDSPRLFRALEAAAMAQAPRMSPGEISQLLAAYARARLSAPALFDALAEEAMQNLEKFDAKDLTHLTWAFAKVDHAHPRLFDAIGESIAPRAFTFRPQDLSTTAWAFARVRHHSSPRLLDALAAEAVSNLPAFKPQSLATVAWAFAELRHPAPELYDAIADMVWRLGTEAFDDVRAQTMLEKAFERIGEPVPEFAGREANARRARRERRQLDRLSADGSVGGQSRDGNGDMDDATRLRRLQKRRERHERPDDEEAGRHTGLLQRFIHERAIEAVETYFEERGGGGRRFPHPPDGEAVKEAWEEEEVGKRATKSRPRGREPEPRSKHPPEIAG